MSKSSPGIGLREDAPLEDKARTHREIGAPPNGDTGVASRPLDTDFCYEEGGRRAAPRPPLRIVKDVRARPILGGVTLPPEARPFDLRAAVEDVAHLLAPRAYESGVELVLRYQPDAPRQVVGDAGRARQLLLGLLGNAVESVVEFARARRVLVQARCERGNEPRAGVRFSVEVEGVGIPEDALAHILEPLGRTHASTTRQPRTDVTRRRHEQGPRGAHLLATLPFPPAESQIEIPPNLRGLRVLVVDDCEPRQQAVVELVTAWGMRAGTAASGKEALQTLWRASVDGKGYPTVLLDHRLPDMAGEEAAVTIHSGTGLRETVVVLLGPPRWRPEARLPAVGGISAWLAKPPRASQLFDTLVAAIGERKGAAGPPALHRPGVLPPPVPLAGGRPLRVLVAEDCAANQGAMVRTLDDLGCRADVAANGREAVKMTQILSYDVVFMDCEMPEMDGLAATAEIRRREDAARRTPIVGLTAAPCLGTSLACVEAGMDDYIGKPVRTRDVEWILARWAGALR